MKKDGQHAFNGPDNAGPMQHDLIMLAISNLRYNEPVIECALQMAVNFKRMLILFVNDRDFTNCYLGSYGWFASEGLQMSDKKDLEEHEKKNQEKIAAIIKKADLRGIETDIKNSQGDFALRVLEAVDEQHPDVVVTTRRWKYKWQRILFGSCVDKIIKHANCRVVEV